MRSVTRCLVLTLGVLLAGLYGPAEAAYTCFNVPNAASASFAAQARVFSQDFQILADAARGNGVVFAAGDCLVTQRAAGANMSVDIAACTVVSEGATASVSSGNVAVSAADATNPRIDIVSATNAGVKTVTAGTPAASPLPPTIPQSGGVNNLVLAFVYVPAADTAISNSQITDKRMCVNTPGGGGGAGTGLSYITKVAEGTLSNEFALGSLATGLLQNTVTTGVPTSIAPTDDNVVIGNGTTWQLKALPSCSGATDALAYTTATNTVSCNTIATAGTGLSYITKSAEAGLSAEFSLGSLTTGLLLNTVSGGTGTPSAYAGGSCTNQFVTATNASGALTCTTVTLAGAQFANQGTTTTVLHGNAAGNPSFAAVSLTADVSGDLPFANLTQGSALSVLGVTGNSTADVASIVAANDAEVLRRSGTTVGFGTVVAGGLASNAVTTAKILDANVTKAKIENVAASKLLGRGDSGAGAPEEITLGLGLSMTGTTLAASGGSSSVPVNNQTGTTYTVLNGDNSKLLTFSNAGSIAVTLPQAGAGSAFLSGWFAFFENRGVGTVTITPTTSTVDGAATLVLTTNQGATIASDGTNYFTGNRGVQSGGAGTVTNVATAAPITGGPITTTGTIGIDALVNAQTGTTYTVVSGDKGKLVTHTNASAIAVTLPQEGGSFPAGWFYDTQNRGAGTATITPTTSTIDGAATLAITTGTGTRIFSDGTNYFTQRGQAGSTDYAGSACAVGSSVTAISAAGVVTCNPGVVRLAADVSTSVSASYADVTGMTFTPAANKDYLIEFFVIYTGDSATVGMDYAVNGPASPTSISCFMDVQQGASTYITTNNQAYDTNAANTVSLLTGQNMLMKGHCHLRNGANSTAFTLRHRLETGTAAVNTTKIGSVMRYTLLN